MIDCLYVAMRLTGNSKMSPRIHPMTAGIGSIWPHDPGLRIEKVEKNDKNKTERKVIWTKTCQVTNDSV